MCSGRVAGQVSRSRPSGQVVAGGIGGVLATQILPFADPQTLAVYEAFEREIYRNASTQNRGLKQ